MSRTMNKIREIVYGFQIRHSEKRLNAFIEETKRRAREGTPVLVTARLHREPIDPLDYIRDFDRDEVRVQFTAQEGSGDAMVGRRTKNLLIEVAPRRAGKAMQALMQAEKDAQKGKPTEFQMSGQWIDDISGIGHAVESFNRMARYRDRFQGVFQNTPNLQLEVMEVDDNGRVIPFIEFK